MTKTRRLVEAKADLAYVLRRIARLLRPPVTITPAPDNVIFDRDVEIRVRDGTILRANIFRPTDQGRYPVIMCAHPYGKDHLPAPGKPLFQYRLMQQSMPITHSAWTGWEGPDPSQWVPQGYVVVNLDLRGFGHSQGTSSLLSEQEGEDYHDAIQWVAQQPWSTGKVGLNGVSYLALAQWRAAATRPPALAAICPWEGFSDLYRDLARPGGIQENGFFKLWSQGVKRSAHTPLCLRDEQVARENFDAWWQACVPDLEAIGVPALICASFSDQLLHTGGSFRAFDRIGSKQKWLYAHRGPKWGVYYSAEAQALQTRFFDHFLKRKPNGFEQTPAVHIKVHATRETVHCVLETNHWPPEDVQPVPLFLHPDHRLEPSPAPQGNTAFDMRRGRTSFLWTVPRDMMLIGKMRLQLFVEVIGANDVLIFASVHKFSDGREVAFEGSYGFPLDNVTKGWLKASKRALGPAAEKIWDVPLGFEKKQLLSPGEIVAIDMPLMESATFFQAGDLIRLDIQGRWPSPFNPLTGNFPAAYQKSDPGTCLVHMGCEYPAQLIVPMMPAPNQSERQSERFGV